MLQSDLLKVVELRPMTLTLQDVKQGMESSLRTDSHTYLQQKQQ